MSNKSKRPPENGALKNVATAAGEVPGAFKLKPAARYLGGLSVPTMHRLIRQGPVTSLSRMCDLLFSKAELDRFLSEHTT